MAAKLPLHGSSFSRRTISLLSLMHNLLSTPFLCPRSSTPRRVRARLERVVVGRERFPDPLGERLGGQLRILALGPELLHRDVARGVDLGPGDDPGRAVLVPDPDVLHLQVEE